MGASSQVFLCWHALPPCNLPTLKEAQLKQAFPPFRDTGPHRQACEPTQETTEVWVWLSFCVLANLTLLSGGGIIR